MKSNRRLLGLATVFIASAALTSHLDAQTFNFTRGVANTFGWNNNIAFGDGLNNWGTTPVGEFPNAAGVTANLLINTTATQTINLGQNITVGQLVLGNGGSANTRTVQSGGAGAFVLTLDNNAADALVSQTSSSIGNLTAAVGIAGNGVFTLSNTSSGQLNINGGITSLLASGTQTVNKTGSGVVTVNSVIGNGSAGGTVAVGVSAGTLNLNSVNTYTGATTLSGGTLSLGSTAGSLSTSSTITNNGVLSIGRTNTVIQGTDFSGSDISGTGEVRAIGSGLNLTLNTANTYQGNTTIGTSGNNSVVRATASGALGSGTIQFDGFGNTSSARLELSGGIALNNATIVIAGRNISAAAIQNSTGNNSLSGNIGLIAGGSSYIVQSNSGVLTLSGGIANASGTGTRTFTVAGDGGGLLSGAVTNGTGTTALTKAGGGTWEISGSTNTYTGATTVSAGTLLVNGSLGSTPVSVAAAGTIGGTGSMAGSLAFNAAALFEVVDFTDLLAVTGTITFGSGFGIDNLTGINWASLDLNTPYAIISTSQTFSTSDLGNFGIANAASVGGGRFAYFDNGSLAVVVIPEPSVALLGGIGILMFLRRRR